MHSRDLASSGRLQQPLSYLPAGRRSLRQGPGKPWLHACNTHCPTQSRSAGRWGEEWNNLRERGLEKRRAKKLKHLCQVPGQHTGCTLRFPKERRRKTFLLVVKKERGHRRPWGRGGENTI